MKNHNIQTKQQEMKFSDQGYRQLEKKVPSLSHLSRLQPAPSERNHKKYCCDYNLNNDV